jgi:hypothetical protein
MAKKKPSYNMLFDILGLPSTEHAMKKAAAKIVKEIITTPKPKKPCRTTK